MFCIGSLFVLQMVIAKCLDTFLTWIGGMDPFLGGATLCGALAFPWISALLERGYGDSGAFRYSCVSCAPFPFRLTSLGSIRAPQSVSPPRFIRRILSPHSCLPGGREKRGTRRSFPGSLRGSAFLRLAFSMVFWFSITLAAADQTPLVSLEELKKGRELALLHCAVCHPFPEPNLMDKRTWQNGTLPFLRARLGFDQLDPKNPEQKVVLDEWNLIWNYILASAPQTALPSKRQRKINPDLQQFTVVNPQYRPGTRYVTFTQIDSEERQIYVGNAATKTLDVLDQNGAMLSSLSVDSPPVELVKRPEGWYCTLIGRVPPHNQRLGKLALLEKTGAGFAWRSHPLTNLQRPTHCTVLDMNGDGREDLVMSEYGNILGALTWYEKSGDGEYVPHVLYDRPGAVRTERVDFNHDGRSDLLVMMAQAKEGIYALINQGDGEFFEVPIMEHHPVWGYSGFQLVDFNRDGFQDLLTTNGDNGEYPACLKNYHGVRLYLNDGRNRFKQSFFFPMNGAFKAVAADFDQDGDMDIAAISYFADYEGSPEESFVYLQNLGQFTFEPYTFPQGSSGRWLVMDVGDADGDGDLDIVMGSANRTPYKVPRALYAQWMRKGPTLLLLKNNLRSDPRAAAPESKPTK